MKNGWKEFHLTAEAVEREMAPGMVARLWGYNGSSPGPTIECVEGDKVRILISDNGQGVPDHRRNRIFRPFGDKGLEGPYTGQETGLGLALSRSIAKAMGGDLTLQEDARNGATFVLSFEAPLIIGDVASCVVK